MNENLLSAIKKYCKESNTLHRCSSYGLKQLFEEITGDYISNNEFKLTMAFAGFKPVAVNDSINCRFYVSIVGNVPMQYLGDGYWYRKKKIKGNGRI